MLCDTPRAATAVDRRGGVRDVPHRVVETLRQVADAVPAAGVRGVALDVGNVLGPLGVERGAGEVLERCLERRVSVA